jgi:hypothetical protein
LPVFSPIIGTFGYGKQIANIANALRVIGTFGYGKQIANIAKTAKTANGPTARPPDRPTPIDHAPGTRCQAWIVMPIRSVIVLFARSLFAVGFLLAKPPPGPTAWPVRAGGSTRNFFIFTRPTAH